jgi:membrane peptidoglycan carboxypeptidase
VSLVAAVTARSVHEVIGTQPLRTYDPCMPATTSRRGPAGPHALRQLVVLSVALGLVVAAAALPFVGSAALAARNAARTFEQLPSGLEAPPPPARSTLLAKDGTTIGEIAYQNRVQVPLAAISPPMRAAIVAIEDSRFYLHNGIDVRGALRALARNSTAGTVEEGGSTLTQQYVKNVLVTDATNAADRDAAQEQTLTRKLQEARYAIALEKRLTKDEILERYLNIAYFGDGAYGVQAAATHYFNVNADQLSLAQAATLAGIVQSPLVYDPTVNPDAAQRRRDMVLTRMQQEGLATSTDVTIAKATPIAAYLDVTEFRAGCVRSAAPYFCDYVLSVIKTDKAFGATAEDRISLLTRGGLTIRTTIDPNLQASAQRIVDKEIPRKDKSGKATAVVTVQPGTGAIQVMAQNRTFASKGRGATTINYSVGSKNNGWADGVQAGSTFKTFTLAAALERGVPIGTYLSTSSNQTFSGFKGCDGTRYKPYPVRSSTGGTQSMQSATALSVNGYFVELERRVGLCATAKTVDALGVRTATGKKVPRVPSLTLGTAATTPLDMASAYATLAADGVRCKPVAITDVRDRDGRELDVPSADCAPAVPAAVAQSVTQMLTGVIDGPLRSRTGAAMTLGRPAAGKTGTTENNAAVWFVGYTPQLATAVWVGDPRGGSLHPLRNVTINGRFYSELFGGTFAGPIWKQVMAAGHRDLPRRKFTPPDPAGGVNGVPTQVPDLRNAEITDAMERLEDVGLEGEIDPLPRASALPAGTVLWTSPGAGARLRSGNRVRVVISSGVPLPPPPTPTVPATPTAPAVPVVPTVPLVPSGAARSGGATPTGAP